MLINYLPPILQEIREYKLIMSDGDIENKDLYTAVADLKNNQYITTMNEAGAARYEKMLKIVTKGTDTLEDRRFRILSLYLKQLPYTKIRLEQDLMMLCGVDGYTMAIDYESYILTVRIDLKAKAMFQTVWEYLNSVVPLNMIIDLRLLYNEHHFLHSFTHEELAGFTHQQIREEVII